MIKNSAIFVKIQKRQTIHRQSHAAIPPQTGLATWLATLLLLLGCGIWPAHADIPEPDYILYGSIVLGAAPVTAQQTNVVIEARQSTGGPIVTSYRMGANPVYGDFYSIRVPVEAFLPLKESSASRVGGMVYLTVRDASGTRVQKSTSIASRGKLVRIDFIEADTDADGLPDAWEQRYFTSATAASATADADGDGRSNLAEFLEGTNPLMADGRHPADFAPADDLLTLQEVGAYSLSWQTGAAWPKEPTNIPISYLTRAASLWASGGHYGFANSPATNAPMWWVKAPPQGSSPAGTNLVMSSFPGSILMSQPLVVNVVVTPDTNVQAHAVEDQIPAGWTVTEISHGGNFDSVNHKVKWGPFYDAGERELYYELSAPANVTGSFTFSGTGSFDGLDTPVEGSRLLLISVSGISQFTSSGRDAQGPKFTLLGLSSRNYLIEVSSTLTNWTTLTNVTTDEKGECLFRPLAPSDGADQFYRARATP